MRRTAERLKQMMIEINATKKRKAKGRKLSKKLLWAMGYVYIWWPRYHRVHFNNWAKRADLVLEAKIGRHLAPNEIAHHKNQIRSDDRPSNLEVKTKGQHAREHYYDFKAARKNSLQES